MSAPSPVVERERTAADRLMRRWLRAGDVVDKNAILGARRSTTAAIVVSGIRCIITYLLIPILAPVIGISDAASAPVTIALSARHRDGGHRCPAFLDGRSSCPVGLHDLHRGDRGLAHRRDRPRPGHDDLSGP